MSISKEQNMFVAHERVLSDIVERYDQYPVSTDMEVYGLPIKHASF